METNFASTQAIKVYAVNEATLGDAYTTATGWTELPVTSYTIPEISAPVETSAQRVGTYTNRVDQTAHRLDTKMYTFDLTLKGNVEAIDFACELLFEASSSPYVLAGDYSFPDYKNGTATGNSHTICFSGAGADATSVDIVCAGVIATGMTISEAVDSENGDLVLVVNCVTGYQPSHTAQTITSPTLLGGSPKNIKSLSVYNIDTEDLHIFSWELGFTRTIERVASVDYSAYEPYGYEQTGAWEVTGSITCKRDDSVHDLLAKLKSGTIDVNIAESSGFTIDIPTAKINESAVDSGGSFLKQTIPFTAYANDEDDTIVSITAS